MCTVETFQYSDDILVLEKYVYYWIIIVSPSISCSNIHLIIIVNIIIVQKCNASERWNDHQIDRNIKWCYSIWFSRKPSSTWFKNLMNSKKSSKSICIILHHIYIITCIRRKRKKLRSRGSDNVVSAENFHCGSGNCTTIAVNFDISLTHKAETVTA